MSTVAVWLGREFAEFCLPLYQGVLGLALRCQGIPARAPPAGRVLGAPALFLVQ